MMTMMVKRGRRSNENVVRGVVHRYGWERGAQGVVMRCSAQDDSESGTTSTGIEDDGEEEPLLNEDLKFMRGAGADLSLVSYEYL